MARQKNLVKYFDFLACMLPLQKIPKEGNSTAHVGQIERPNVQALGTIFWKTEATFGENLYKFNLLHNN